MARFRLEAEAAKPLPAHLPKQKTEQQPGDCAPSVGYHVSDLKRPAGKPSLAEFEHNAQPDGSDNQDSGEPYPFMEGRQEAENEIRDEVEGLVTQRNGGQQADGRR